MDCISHTMFLTAWHPLLLPRCIPSEVSFPRSRTWDENFCPGYFWRVCSQPGREWGKQDREGRIQQRWVFKCSVASAWSITDLLGSTVNLLKRRKNGKKKNKKQTRSMLTGGGDGETQYSFRLPLVCGLWKPGKVILWAWNRSEKKRKTTYRGIASCVRVNSMQSESIRQHVNRKKILESLLGDCLIRDQYLISP